jgi:hypothetical protein
MSKNYFEKLDKTIKQNKSNIEKKKKDDKENDEQVKKIIIAITPLLSNYEKELKERNIKVKLTIYDTFFSFLMYYKNGGHHGFELSKDYERNLYRFVGKFTNDDGKSYDSFGGGPQILEDFQIEEFENYLQKEIDEFFFYANRFGGI